MEENRKTAIQRIFSAVDIFTDMVIILAVFLVLSYSVYGLIDTKLVIESAAPIQYEEYKPKDDFSSIDKLKEINPDVIGWIEIFGTTIDYPILQADDDWTYVNTDARGNYSLTGSIFLSSKNRRDFSDFNNIIYGHNMTPQIMFGGIKDFKEEKFFNSHQYGNIFYKKKHHGIMLFGILEADAYDWFIYNPGIQGLNEKDEYLEKLEEECIYKRDIKVNADDNIVLLSTCSNESTNKREILLGKITDKTYDNPFKNADEVSSDRNHLKTLNALFFILLAVFIVLILLRRRRRKNRNAYTNKQ